MLRLHRGMRDGNKLSGEHNSNFVLVKSQVFMFVSKIYIIMTRV